MNSKEVRLAVLYGGTSSERQISLMSGDAVYDALRSSRDNVMLIDTQQKDFMNRLKARGVQLVFIALHGRYGEDGELQSLLQREGISFTGSSPEACRRAMNKDEARRCFLRAGLSVPKGQVIREPGELKRQDLSLPLFVKPCSGGSSIGVTLVREKDELESALQSAFKEDSRVLVEERIVGREITVGILGGDAMPLIEVLPKREFFDYAAKYEDTGTAYAEPEDLAEDVRKRISESAVKAHTSLGCSAFSRVDMMLDSGGTVFILEVNAIPGLTKKSLLPKMASKMGISFDELCERILEESLRSDHNRTARMVREPSL